MPALSRSLTCLLGCGLALVSCGEGFAQGPQIDPIARLQALNQRARDLLPGRRNNPPPSPDFPTDEQERLELLGKLIFNDTNLSNPPGQGCVTCHDPSTGFTSADSSVNLFFGPHPGAVPSRSGPRKPPSAAYAGDSGPLRPILPPPPFGARWEGGVFWDGRATGLSEDLADPLAEQALGPFVNPVEQNMKDKRAVIKKVSKSAYKELFELVWGENSLDWKDPEVVEEAYNQMVIAIAAFERSDEVNPFDSKFDHWLNGSADLTDQEKLGLWLFENPNDPILSDPPPGATIETHGKANCFICHPSAIGPNGEPPLFTDFAYHNIGTPKNPTNPFYAQPKKFNPDGADFIDRGLAATLEARGEPADEVARQEGAHKTPTLRNVNLRPSPDFVKAYAHNGFFKSMDEIVHFYNTRDVPEENWPAPEVPDTAAGFIMGNLGLTPEEEAAIVAFMATLSDGYSQQPAE